MKKLMAVLCLMLCMAAAARAQESLLGTSQERGWFAAPVVKITPLKSTWGAMIGLRGAMILDRKLSFGLGYYGLGGGGFKSDVNDAAGNKMDYKFSYGGLELEYVFNPDNIYHWTVFGLLGLGNVGFKGGEDSNFYLFEPGVNWMARITSYFEAGVGLSYRIVTGVDAKNIDSNGTGGPAINLTLKFGKF